MKESPNTYVTLCIRKNLNTAFFLKMYMNLRQCSKYIMQVCERKYDNLQQNDGENDKNDHFCHRHFCYKIK